MSHERNFHIYRDLADLEERRGAQQLRDRFLILAADAALSAGLHGDAEELRARLLQTNPHHLLRPYHSFTEALRSADVYSYIADLRSSYPPEEAERLLAAEGGHVPPQETETPRGASGLPLMKAAGQDEPDLKHAEAEARSEEPAVLPLAPRAETKKGRKLTLDLVRQEGPAGLEEMPERAPTYREPEQPPRPARRRPQPEEEPSPVSYWTATMLFAIVLAAGIVLAVYTVARPFVAL